jgi:hypothetical protein
MILGRNPFFVTGVNDMNWKTTLLAAVAICGLALPSLAVAQNIKGPAQITASTNMPDSSTFVIAQIADGDSSDVNPFQGFASSAPTGVINLAFDRPYNLTAFHLSNDINVRSEGITRFTLKFLNSANNQIGNLQTFNPALSTLAQQNFPLGNVANVAKVEMAIDDSNDGVEIREVSFTGTTTPTPIPCPGADCTNTDFSTCCPPSATFNMNSLFSTPAATLGSPYYYDFAGIQDTQASFAALNAQMVAYLNYVRALDPSYKGFAMTFRLLDGGTGPTAVAGAQIGTDSSVYWNAGATTGALWPNSTFFGPTTAKPVNNWTVIEMVLWTQGPGRPYAQSCEKRYITWRPQMATGRMGAGQGGRPNFIPYTGPAPTSAARQPAARR